MNDSGWNMYVFRDGRRTVSGAELIASLAGALLPLAECAGAGLPKTALLAALIAAGELECALLDGAKQ